MCKLCRNTDDFKEELVLLETKHCLVLANLFPIGTYSFLIITKRHISSLIETSKEESDEIMYLQKMVMSNVKNSISCDINCFVNEGEIAGQTIPHFHLHIVARFENDGIENFKRNCPPDLISQVQLEKHRKILHNE